jgi:uncharacterized membrane protein
MMYNAAKMTQSARHHAKVLHYILDSVIVLILVVLVAFTVALHVTRPVITGTNQQASAETTVRAKVLSIQDERLTTDANGLTMVYQKLEVIVLSRGEYKDTVVVVDYNGLGPSEHTVKFRVNGQALLMTSHNLNGEITFLVADHIRLFPIATIILIFVCVTLIIGRWQGARALIGLVLSGFVIVGFIVPQILALRDPVVVSLVGTALLLAMTLYLIQGWNAAGHSALFGMFASLVMTGLLSWLWTRYAYLTGFGSEETLFLQASGISVQMQGLLLAGIIIGAASVLDDVVIAQAVVIFELSAANPALTRHELYRSGMKIGTTHLASMVNTLVLAYTSTALPLIMLFFIYPEPWYLTINREFIAEEIIRAIVGSVALMLAVPLTTFIAATVAHYDTQQVR